MKDHVTGRMTWAVTHTEGLFADGDSVVAVEPAVRFERAGVDTVFAAGFLDPVDPKLILGMRPFNGQVQAFR